MWTAPLLTATKRPSGSGLASASAVGVLVGKGVWVPAGVGVGEGVDVGVSIGVGMLVGVGVGVDVGMLVGTGSDVFVAVAEGSVTDVAVGRGLSSHAVSNVAVTRHSNPAPPMERTASGKLNEMLKVNISGVPFDGSILNCSDA